jgi:hypothetical protein
MTHSKDTSLENFYDLTVNSVSSTYTTTYVLNRGLVKLGIDKEGANPFNYETLKASWTSSTAIPTEDAIKTAAVSQIETDISLAYQWKRANEYPQLKEQLDSLYKDIVAGTITTSGAFATAIKAVKDKYPKS